MYEYLLRSQSRDMQHKMVSSVEVTRNEEEIVEKQEVKWIDKIFVPCHFCLKLMVLIVVIIKCAMVSVQCFLFS